MKAVKHEDVNVVITKRNICVEIARSNTRQHRDDPIVLEPIETLVDGKFEHPIDRDSVCWLIENDEPCIVIYVDKAEEMWWKKLLFNEEVTEAGPRSYTVPMDNLDDESRMRIDKLICDQRNKLLSKDDQYSPA